MLPSSTLQHKSPHEILSKQKLDYSMLKAFGSACFPYLRPMAAHKLEPRSLKCVFLGYSPQHKGYRCLYPPAGKVYISKHVVFDEERFPFMDQYKNQVPVYDTPLLKASQTSSASPEPSSQSQLTRIFSPPQQFK